jgi:hypothetical protein
MSRKVTIGPSGIHQEGLAFLNFAREKRLASFLLKGAGSEAPFGCRHLTVAFIE